MQTALILNAVEIVYVEFVTTRRLANSELSGRYVVVREVGIG